MKKFIYERSNISPLFKKIFNFFSDTPSLKSLLSKIPVTSEKIYNIADYGCGCGADIKELFQCLKVHTYYAVDNDDNAIEAFSRAASKNNLLQKIEFIDADISAKTKRIGCGIIDLSFCNFVFSSVKPQNYEYFFNNILSASVDNGKILITDFNENGCRNFLKNSGDLKNFYGLKEHLEKNNNIKQIESISGKFTESFVLEKKQIGCR